MKRGWFGAGILVIFLVLGLITGKVLDSVHKPTGELLKEAAEKTLSGDFEEGISLARKARDRWQQQWHATAMVADHTPMEDVDALFAELEIYAKSGEAPHFAACCAELAQRIEAVAEAHSGSWWNVL